MSRNKPKWLSFEVNHDVYSYKNVTKYQVMPTV